MTRTITAVALGVLTLAALGRTAYAGATPTQKCEGAKLKLVCKKVCCELGIVAKEGADFTKCTSGFSAGFGKIKGTCGVAEPTLEAKVDAFRTDVANELKPASNKCEAAKIKGVCKKVCCELGADGKAVVKGGTADLTKCTSKFSATFGKLETRGGCATSGDTTTIENKVDAFVEDVFDEVTQPPCTVAGAACGTCGTGTCQPHCGVPGSPLTCAQSSTGNPLCHSDAECPTATPRCVAPVTCMSFGFCASECD